LKSLAKGGHWTFELTRCRNFEQNAPQAINSAKQAGFRMVSDFQASKRGGSPNNYKSTTTHFKNPQFKIEI
jgi:hypothetical protein